MKRLILFAFVCSILTACGSSDSGTSGFSLSDIRPPAAGKINLIFKNLESQSLSGAFFSTSGSAGSFTDLLPSAQSFPDGNFVVFDQTPATYSYNFKFGTGASAITSPTKISSVLSAANKNVTMGANQTNTGTVAATTPVSTSSSSSTSSTSSSSSSGSISHTGYTCSSTSYVGNCSTLTACINNNNTGSGFYETSRGTFTWSTTSGISAAAQQAATACTQ